MENNSNLRQLLNILNKVIKASEASLRAFIIKDDFFVYIFCKKRKQKGAKFENEPNDFLFTFFSTCRWVSAREKRKQKQKGAKFENEPNQNKISKFKLPYLFLFA